MRAKYLADTIYTIVVLLCFWFFQTLAADLVDLRRRINLDNLKDSIEKIHPPTYNPNCFETEQVYDEWKEYQLRRVNNLIQEWCPKYIDKEMKRLHPFDIINGYRILIKEFFL